MLRKSSSRLGGRLAGMDAGPVLIFLLCSITLWSAKLPVDQCGSHAGRAHEEVFLHRQHAAARARLKLPAATAAGNQDIGQIAVIDDSGGVIGRRNPFSIDGKTLVFTPGYSVSTMGDSFDSTAATSGALIAGFRDDDSRKFDLTFAFPFFGKSYQQVWVDSNGMLTFTAGDPNANGSFGYFQAGLPAIAGLFTDLDPSSSSDGVRVRSESGRFVVTWSQVPLYGLPQTQTFQIRLYPDGRIEIAYRSMHVNDGVVGISAGGHASVSLVDFAGAVSGSFRSGVAEIFASTDAVDIVAASQKFYQTHDDAYDYLVFYNAEGVAAGPGVVAYESTVRSSGKGYGDSNYDYGSEYGSARRLQSVLNLGPLSQYPLDPNAAVPSRGSTGDTSLTILGHEAGHLFLALVSVPDPSGGSPPMLGRSLVHWAFTFNSDASFLEGNRIEDRGATASPRFVTTATVAGYSPLDQYLMGFLPPDRVPPTFAVLHSGQGAARPPQTGVEFSGDRFDIRIEDVIKAAGPRVPDSTVAQRRYRFAFVVIAPAGSTPDVSQVDRYRIGFEALFSSATNGIASADTSLKKSTRLSLAPAAGVVMGTAGLGAIELASPAPSTVTYALSAPAGILSVPASVTIAAGATRATFPINGTRAGVEEFTATPSDGSYETAYARVQVLSSASSLHLAAVSSDPRAVTVRAVDANNLPYSGIHLSASVSDQGSVNPASLVTDERGLATLQWTPGSSNILTVRIESGASIQVTPFGKPVIIAAANAASFSSHIAPGSFVSLAGVNLSASGDAQVIINESRTTVYYASDTLINFVVPRATFVGAASLVVQSSAGTSDPFPISLDAVAPGVFFESSTGYGAILIAGTADVTQVHPAAVGDYISIYCTGLGGSSDAKVEIGGVEIPVSYAGPTIIPGLDQVNALIPSGTPSGMQSLSLSIDGIRANEVKIQIAQ